MDCPNSLGTNLYARVRYSYPHTLGELVMLLWTLLFMHRLMCSFFGNSTEACNISMGIPSKVLSDEWEYFKFSPQPTVELHAQEGPGMDDVFELVVVVSTSVPPCYSKIILIEMNRTMGTTQRTSQTARLPTEPLRIILGIFCSVIPRSPGCGEYSGVPTIRLRTLMARR